MTLVAAAFGSVWQSKCCLHVQSLSNLTCLQLQSRLFENKISFQQHDTVQGCTCFHTTWSLCNFLKTRVVSCFTFLLFCSLFEAVTFLTSCWIFRWGYASQVHQCGDIVLLFFQEIDLALLCYHRITQVGNLKAGSALSSDQAAWGFGQLGLISFQEHRSSKLPGQSVSLLFCPHEGKAS